MPQQRSGNLLLALIVFSQFAGTSLWFTGNAILDELALSRNIRVDIAWITSSVIIGFIAGTMVFALLSIADKFQSKSLFFASSLIAALFNFSILWFADSNTLLFIFRFLTGFFLAGIYPVGMKIASDVFPKKTGNALGFLVGALVLGTAFPHLVNYFSSELSFQTTITTSSILAITGGLLVLLFIPKYQVHHPQYFSVSSINQLFKNKSFKAAALGYFGHMWELYAFWAFIPFIIHLHNQYANADLNIPLYSFLVIAIGSLGCIAGGIISRKKGSKPVAAVALLISSLCCILAPFVIGFNTPLFVIFILTWGIAVITDSPQFSALVAKNAIAAHKGTALAFVTSVGFFITIISIQLLELFIESFSHFGIWLLVPGPIIGLLLLTRK